MPIVKDKNGKFIVSGETQDTTPYVPEQPPKPAPPKPKPAAKPWHQQLLNNLQYEAKRVQKDPIGAAATYAGNTAKAAVDTAQATIPQMQAPIAIAKSVAGGKVVNDARFELNQLSNPSRMAARGLSYALQGTLPKFVAGEYTLGTIQAGANIARNVADLGPGDYTQRGFGGIDDAVDQGYMANAAKPPSQMTDAEKNVDDIRASVALQTGLTAASMGAAPLLQGLRLVGPAFQALDPAKAQTITGFLSRFLATQGLEELPSTFLDDNTGGSAFGLFGANADPVKPGMTRFQANTAAFLPNLAVAGAMTSPFILGQLKNIRRAKVSESVRSRRQQARDNQKAAGQIQEDPDTGKTAFTEETLQAKPVETPAPAPVETAAPAPAAEPGTGAALLQAERTKMQGATAVAEAPPKVEAKPETVDPFEQQYDPETPESDALGEALGQADDDQLLLINQATSGIPQVVEETLTRPGPGYNPDAHLDLVAAPKANLAEGTSPWSQRLGSVPTDTLLSLAGNSQELAFKITEMTGKELNAFDRLDVIDGLRAMEGDGMAVMPNRLMGAPLMAVDDIGVDPVRFQFKQGTDAQGQQKGNSLTGVGRWNPDMEGVIQVWTDPMDGKTYVVNGHNRLAKAKELGIPSVRIEQLDAPTAELARSQGALTNIAQGGGTAFDAAKFFRESGITDPAQLETLGVPMKSGLAVEGIALSRLPDNIFQDAIDGKITKGKALALGGSGLDEAGMQAAYKALQGRDMSDATFNEVVQQAKSAPTTAGSQVDLFGNTETLNLMVEKGQLAATIRAELQKDKSLFARVGKNADRLETAGNQIDAAGSQQVAMDAAMAMARFDAEKYADTPLGQLLNEGALQIAEGAKVKPIADRIRRMYAKELEANPTAAKAQAAPAPEAPAAPPAQQAPAASAAPNIDIPPGASRNITARTSEDRIRSAAESLASWTTKPGAEPMSIGQALELVRAKGAILDPDAIPGLDMEKAREDLLKGRPSPEVQAAYQQFYGIQPQAKAVMAAHAPGAPEVRPELKPEERQAVINEIVGKAARNGEVRPPTTPLLQTPRESGVSMEKVARDLEDGVLSDDVVKAIDDELRLADEHKRLDDAMEADRISAEREAMGYDDMTFNEKKGNGLLDGVAPDPRKAAIQDMLADAEAKGDKVLAREMKNALDRLEKKGNGIRMGYYDDFDSDVVTRNQARNYVYRAKTQPFERMLSHASAIYGNAGKALTQSEALATEAAIAMRDAALIAGVQPDMVKYMDRIDMVGIFGADAAAGAMDAWKPHFAAFMRSNPGDPLTRDLGLFSTNGLRVPEDARFGNHRAAIYLALHPALQKRLPGELIEGEAPQAFRKTAFHEAFHSVQDWLFQREAKALEDPAALKEMEAKIRQYGGVRTDDMDALEIQAEAFAVWANNRKLKFEAGGVQSLFERMKQFTNTLGQKLRYILKKDLTYVDVFEMAYRGEIGRRRYIMNLTDRQLDGLAQSLDAQMARNIPELTDRIYDYLQGKKAEAAQRIRDWETKNNKEGC